LTHQKGLSHPDGGTLPANSADEGGRFQVTPASPVFTQRSPA
jgi:hypothetical protein